MSFPLKTKFYKYLRENYLLKPSSKAINSSKATKPFINKLDRFFPSIVIKPFISKFNKPINPNIPFEVNIITIKIIESNYLNFFILSLGFAFRG